MRKLSFIFTIMLICPLVALAQQSEQKLQREARKDVRDIYQAALFEHVEKSVNERSFVVEVDKIRLKSGTSIFTNATTNFISLNGTKATLQLSSNNGAIMGPNGIGGITVDGKASDIKVTKDKKGNLNISMAIQGSIISVQVSINIPKDSNRAIATVIPNFNSYRITLMGAVMSTESSTVFKGRTTP